MPRKREIPTGECQIWLGVLLDAVFDPTSKVVNLSQRAEQMNKEAGVTPNKGWSAQGGKSELLSIARDITDYPEDYPPKHRADLLLRWANRWVIDEDWSRLKARVRKRRQRSV
ncbi:hypothetical protein [Modicisalibacter sp. 'Wilcox']|uniref:hypothetical protein n=1 Tax=Modicisalibacter sp. 'Wilcox' TaxID=2679914 RepID=UPI0013D6D178|nr:hypothetical protein [Modicisalibacter sp. 'Wilcox']